MDNEHLPTYKQERRRWEAEYFREALELAGGQVARCAMITQMERTALHRKLRDLGVMAA